MKYFTKELWDKLNSESASDREQASIEWDKNCDEYWRVFETIKDRLSKKVIKSYLNTGCFHDYDFVSFEVIQPKPWASDPVAVRIVVSDREFEWVLTYKHVQKVAINYDADINSHMFKWGIHEWGYCEFLPVDESYLSHEILFASGASIKLVFKNRNLFIEKVKVPN